MDFQGRYKVLEMLKDGETRTFKALQISSGRTVLVHELWVERTPSNQRDLATLVFGFLRSATADEMKILVDMGEEEGRVFVVTEDLPAFQDLRHWLQPRVEAPGATGKPSVARSAVARDSGPKAAPGGMPTPAKPEGLTSPDRTTLFFTPTKIDKPPVAAPPPSTEKDVAGEFTQVFFGKDAPKPQPARPVSYPPQKPSAPSASKAAGPPESPTSTGLGAAFEPPEQQRRGPTPHTVEPPLPPSPPAPGHEGGAPGDFTRIFFGPEEPKATPPGPAHPTGTARQAPIAPMPSPQTEAAGEFTRLFQAPQMKEKPPAMPAVKGTLSRPVAPPVQPPEQEGSGEFTELFRGSLGASPPAGPALTPGASRPPIPLSASPTPQGSGELTQLMQGYQIGKSAEKPELLEEPKPVAPPPPPGVGAGKPGEFTRIFQRPSDLATAPPGAPAPPVVGTPAAAAPQPQEPDEFMRMFEHPRGGAGAPPQGGSQAPPPATARQGAGIAMPAVPVVSVTPPAVPGMPSVQPPVVSVPTVPQPQPFQIPAPQFQPRGMPPPLAMPQMPQIQPMAVPVPPVPQAGPPQAGKGKFLVPLLILGGLFVIAVVVVLVFALKH